MIGSTITNCLVANGGTGGTGGAASGTGAAGNGGAGGASGYIFAQNLRTNAFTRLLPAAGSNSVGATGGVAATNAANL